MRRPFLLLLSAVALGAVVAPPTAADSPVAPTTPITSKFQPYEMVTRTADRLTTLQEPLATGPSERRVYKLISRVEELDGTQRRATTNSTTTYSLQSTLLFAKDSARLSPSAEKELRRVAGRISAAGADQVDVTGHTDDLGSAAHGLTLSRQRAEAVKKVLEKQTPGVDFTAKGLGERSPIADNATEEGRVKNRRVELGWQGPS
ncbi:OmpA family protein [Streptomyces sp. NPDC058595]|uniref:OmpA family protein n=1 Tax=Streptomyces sp. NPDC058595 TaxID=3346550 RepID=UPI0036636C62